MRKLEAPTCIPFPTGGVNSGGLSSVVSAILVLNECCGCVTIPVSHRWTFHGGAGMGENFAQDRSERKRATAMCDVPPLHGLPLKSWNIFASLGLRDGFGTVKLDYAR